MVRQEHLEASQRNITSRSWRAKIAKELVHTQHMPEYRNAKVRLRNGTAIRVQHRMSICLFPTASRDAESLWSSPVLLYRFRRQ